MSPWEFIGGEVLFSLTKILKENKAKEAKKGSMVAFFLPQDVAKSLVSRFSDVPGDEVEAKDMHITLGLFKDLPDVRESKLIISILDDLSGRIEPFQLEVGHFAAFPPSEHNEHRWILHAKPEMGPLKDIHSMVLDTIRKHGIEIDNGNFAFSPHITIKYATEKPNTDQKIRQVINFSKISFARGGAIKHIALG